MLGLLTHSPADVLRYLLVDHGIGTYPDNPKSDWMIYADNEPDRLDKCITIYNTFGKPLGRSHVDSEFIEMHGIQVRIRASVSSVAFTKARVIAIDLDESTGREVIDIDTSSYCVHSFSRTGGIIPLGKESPTSKRSIYVFNGLLTLRQIS